MTDEWCTADHLITPGQRRVPKPTRTRLVSAGQVRQHAGKAEEYADRTQTTWSDTLEVGDTGLEPMTSTV
jgi:hypothetical protein